MLGLWLCSCFCMVPNTSDEEPFSCHLPKWVNIQVTKSLQY